MRVSLLISSILRSFNRQISCLCSNKRTDKIAICLSLCCIAHCIVMPSLILLLPSVSSLWINNELFHLYIVLLAIPFSFYAILKNFKKNNNLKCVIMAGIGFTLLFLAIILHEFGEIYEIAFTIFGAIVLVFSHFLNMKYYKS